MNTAFDVLLARSTRASRGVAHGITSLINKAFPFLFQTSHGQGNKISTERQTYKYILLWSLEVLYLCSFILSDVSVHRYVPELHM